jgi:hypothetical protein
VTPYIFLLKILIGLMAVATVILVCAVAQEIIRWWKEK